MNEAQTHNDFLIEILCEELPPKSLVELSERLKGNIQEGLKKVGLAHQDIKSYATPRRLAVLVEKLIGQQPSMPLQRRGPALSAAFDVENQPTKACLAFAQSCGVAVKQLESLVTDKGSWVIFNSMTGSKLTCNLLPDIVRTALKNLLIDTPMRWADNDFTFVRPVHSVIMLFGTAVINCEILGVTASNTTRGHRFHAPNEIIIKSPKAYEKQLKEAYVLVDFNDRQQEIKKEMEKEVAKYNAVKPKLDEDPSLIALLEEVTGLIEWPVALVGKFSNKFLELPREVLICSMQTHQRYFHLFDSNKQLLPYFITISNIASNAPAQVIEGNERVINARLSDAYFFYHTDLQTPLVEYAPKLATITYQAELGNMLQKTQRISKLAGHIAQLLGANIKLAERAGYLAKADLLSNMVNEFPELQGTIGGYYAEKSGEPFEVVAALKEYYKPRFASDSVPTADNKTGLALAIADRLDTLVGIFGINKVPTSDKDPFALRRAALGIISIILKRKLSLDLADLLSVAKDLYEVKLPNAELSSQLINFLQERLRYWSLEHNFSADVIATISAKNITNPLDFYKRLEAMREFRQLDAAESLAIAHKRVDNLLSKQAKDFTQTTIIENYLNETAEKNLFHELQKITPTINKLYQATEYTNLLQQLAQLRPSVDEFFTQVMVMIEDENLRNNRLALLSQLRNLFSLVGDISLLQIVTNNRLT